MRIEDQYIAMKVLKRAARHPALQNLPFLPETPKDDEGYIKEIRMPRDWMEEIVP